MLAGDRVVLRPVRPEDVEVFWRMKTDVETWLLTSDHPLQPVTLKEFTEYSPPGESAQFAIEVGGELIGNCGMFHFDMLSRNAEVGLTLLPEHRGQGHGRDALRTLVDYGFRHRNLHRLYLRTLASNEPGLRAYAAVGFVEEGRQREHAWVDGRYDDVVTMSVLRAEWP